MKKIPHIKIASMFEFNLTHLNIHKSLCISNCYKILPLFLLDTMLPFSIHRKADTFDRAYYYKFKNIIYEYNYLLNINLQRRLCILLRYNTKIN